ncbi:hypothetical protein E2C01_046828 [Portunus trituberculatus]|uniref:Uncharacterized protein n=1 Tax=Portunus trituberculatus TaxID=210409 RepID=A0A5B7G5S8_PORTR|nr:hypothetical protein [Portunus trituberculatus]
MNVRKAVERKMVDWECKKDYREEAMLVWKYDEDITGSGEAGWVRSVMQKPTLQKSNLVNYWLNDFSVNLISSHLDFSHSAREEEAESCLNKSELTARVEIFAAVTKVR